MSDDGRVSVVLRPMKNDRGNYYMGNSRIDANLNLRSLVWFARVQDDGSLMISAEQYDERIDKKKGRKQR